jgi:hypothetical protein
MVFTFGILRIKNFVTYWSKLLIWVKPNLISPSESTLDPYKKILKAPSNHPYNWTRKKLQRFQKHNATTTKFEIQGQIEK